MPRKRVPRIYFTKDTEDAIIEYNKTDDQNLKNKLTDNPSKITQIDKLLNVVKSFEKKLKGEIESPPSPNPQNPRLSRLERTFGGTGCSIS